METNQIYDLREEIFEYRYPIIRGIHDEKEYLYKIANEVEFDHMDLECLIDEFSKFTSQMIKNMNKEYE